MDIENFIIFMTSFWVILLLIPFGYLSIVLNNIGASEGTHTGFVTAVEFNNNILWDATLVYFKTDKESTQEDIYCVNDLLLKKQLEDYEKMSRRITIHYENPFWFWRKLCNGGESIIIGIEDTYNE